MKILHKTTVENLIMKFSETSTYLSRWTLHRELEFIKILLIFCDYFGLLGSVKETSWITVENLIKTSNTKNLKVILPPQFSYLNSTLYTRGNTELLKLVTIFEREWSKSGSIDDMGVEKKYFCITKMGMILTIHIKYLNYRDRGDAKGLTLSDITTEIIEEVHIEEYDLTIVDNNLKKLLRRFRNSQKDKKANKRFFIKEFISTLMNEIDKLEPFANWTKLHKNLGELNANLLPHKKAAK